MLDKMLDTADLLVPPTNSPVQMEDEQREALRHGWQNKRCAEHHSENRQITVPTGRRC